MAKVTINRQDPAPVPPVGCGKSCKVNRVKAEKIQSEVTA